MVYVCVEHVHTQHGAGDVGPHLSILPTAENGLRHKDWHLSICERSIFTSGQTSCAQVRVSVNFWCGPAKEKSKITD